MMQLSSKIDQTNEAVMLHTWRHITKKSIGTLSQNINIWLLILIMFTVSACSINGMSSKRTNGAKIIYAGSSEYDRVIATFKVTPEQAKSRVSDHIRAKLNLPSSVKVVTGIHSVLIDHYYLFNFPQMTGDIPLSGYYVDANSGKVEFRESQRSVPNPN